MYPIVVYFWCSLTVILLQVLRKYMIIELLNPEDSDALPDLHANTSYTASHCLGLAPINININININKYIYISLSLSL